MGEIKVGKAAFAYNYSYNICYSQAIAFSITSAKY